MDNKISTIIDRLPVGYSFTIGRLHLNKNYPDYYEASISTPSGTRIVSTTNFPESADYAVAQAFDSFNRYIIELLEENSEMKKKLADSSVSL